MTRRAGAWLAAAGSAAAFAGTVLLRLHAAYGPFTLTLHPGDWAILWELLRHGQIAPGVVLQATALGVAAAGIPWLVFAVAGRRRRPR